RPRIGLLLAGIGMNEAESDAAIRTLPGAVSLAVSPYAAADRPNLPKLLATARTTGHEYLIEIPLEPAGFPLNDPGPSTLLTGAPASANVRTLRWALSRIDGYVGVTGVIGTMRGERLAAMTDQMEAVLAELAGRGLLYVDPREGSGPIPRTWGRHVDLVVDDAADQGVADRAMIDSKLSALEQQARDAGSAVGLVMRPTPVAVARIAAWSNGLVDRGLTLAPVSALVLPPADPAVKLSERQW
ncbi:MAG TPA: divergent polysaccharide deacetylase family protein, partial [Acetobacteraceae bacterium]|nr:divergent polysaccharide deacetylase family protein [Acetobacteraceae bacterium]